MLVISVEGGLAKLALIRTCKATKAQCYQLGTLAKLSTPDYNHMPEVCKQAQFCKVLLTLAVHAVAVLGVASGICTVISSLAVHAYC